MHNERAPHGARKLFHVSEEEHIARFDPRPADAFPQPVVWGVDEEHLRNYMLPRDCPRVTFYATPDSTREDIERFLGGEKAVVTIEQSWLQRGARMRVVRVSPAKRELRVHR